MSAAGEKLFPGERHHSRRRSSKSSRRKSTPENSSTTAGNSGAEMDIAQQPTSGETVRSDEKPPSAAVTKRRASSGSAKSRRRSKTGSTASGGRPRSGRMSVPDLIVTETNIDDEGYRDSRLFDSDHSRPESMRERKPSFLDKVVSKRVVRVLLTKREIALLKVTSAITVLGMVVLLTSVSTNYWLYFRAAVPIKEGAGLAIDPNVTSFSYWDRSGNAGLWTVCIRVKNGTRDTTAAAAKNFTWSSDLVCRGTDVYPLERKVGKEPKYFKSEYYLGKIRAGSSFSVVTLVVMTMGFGFGIYSLREKRYTFKRLTAGVHFLAVACSGVTLQSIMRLVTDNDQHKIFPLDTIFTYGYSFALYWAVFGVNVFAMVVFGIEGRKKKLSARHRADGQLILA